MRFILAALAFLFLLAGPAAAYDPDCKMRFGPDGPVCVGAASAEPAPASGRRAQRHSVPITAPLFSFGGDCISTGRLDLGKSGAQLGMRHRNLWCGEWLGRVARACGIKVPANYASAGAWRSAGTRISGPQPGAIALVGGGRGIRHVGLVTGIDPNGNPILLSGNAGPRIGGDRRVTETPYPRGSIAAYILPGA